MTQGELIPGLGQEVEGLTPELEKLTHTLEWARIEEFVPAWHGTGRPPKDRGALANGFVAKAVPGLSATVALIDRLTVDLALRRICGFSRWKKLPDEAVRHNERTVAERTNARLKDGFGGSHIWVKGNAKVMSHLMFGLLALTVDQLMRLLQ